MKGKKIKLTKLQVNSFVTQQSAALKGGAPVKTAGNNCVVDIFSEKCEPTGYYYGCEASIEIVCSGTLARIDCI